MSSIDPRGDGGGPRGADPASSWCALCGAGYVGGIAECADCVVPLGDRPPLSPDDIGGDDGEQVAYEYDDLDPVARHGIDRLLANEGIVHAWEGTTLVVAPYDEDEVDRLLDDDGEGEPDVDDALLDATAEQVIYDLADWGDDRRAELDGRLEAAGLAHAFDESGDLVVLAADEEQVDSIVDAIEFPDQLTVDDGGEGDGDGLEAVNALGRLFVATDRLVHDPTDTEGTLSAVDASRSMATMATPFGFAPPVWDDLVTRAGALQSLLETEAEVVDDDAVAEEAVRLRTALRPYV